MMPHVIEQTTQEIKPSMEKTDTERSFSSDGTYDGTKPPNVWRSWGFDVIICAGGLVSFLIIVVVLYLYDQQRPPKWPMDITLNSLLALLSTISKAAFMISLAEVMSQWKWNMFSTSKGRPIHDFYLIDLASRGFLGSCRLVGRFKWRHPVSLAGIISILSALTSPITQQAISFPTRPVGSYGQAQVGIANQWVGTSDALGINPALTAGLYYPFSKPPSAMEASCPTGECTFPSYSSLAVCAKAADVSQFLVTAHTAPEGRTKLEDIIDTFRDEALDEIELPAIEIYNTLSNNLTLDTTLPYAIKATPGNASLAFVDDEALSTTFVDYFVIYKRTWDELASNSSLENMVESPPEFGAIEVILYMCVNDYETVVEEGKSRTVIKSSSSIPVSTESSVTEFPIPQCVLPPFPEGGTMYCPNTELKGNMTLASSGDASTDDGNQTFTFDLSTVSSAATIINISMYSVLRSLRGDDDLKHFNFGALWLVDALYGRHKNITDPKVQTEGIQEYYQGVATSLSNHLRSTSSIGPLLGTAWREEVYVNVRWGWLAFLAVELVLAGAFILATIIATRALAVPVLKSSVLAALIAPDKEVQQSMGVVGDMKVAENRAKLTHARFDHRNLVFVEDTSGN